MNREYDFSSRSREPLPDQGHERPRDQVRRGRFNSNLRNHDASTGLRCLLIFFDHIPNVGNLSRDIEIMGSILSASFESMLSVQSIRPDSADEDFRLFGQSAQICIIQFADFDTCGALAVRLKASYLHVIARKGGDSDYFLPGWILSGLMVLISATTASSLLALRPATAHRRFVGKLLVMCSAVSFPV
jgi:hypothetical protein